MVTLSGSRSALIDLGSRLKSILGLKQVKVRSSPHSSGIVEWDFEYDPQLTEPQAEVLAASLGLPKAQGELASGPDFRLWTGRPLPSMADIERAWILHVLAQCGGNKSRTARMLGIDRRTLYRKVARWIVG